MSAATGRCSCCPMRSLDPAEVRYAAVWKPRAGELAAFPNLRVIFNLGAGVDALIADASLPDVPVVRVAVDDLTMRMTEYVVLHVLAHHRQEIYLRASQREKRWEPKYPVAGRRHFRRDHGPRQSRIERRRGAQRFRFQGVGLEQACKKHPRRQLLSRQGWPETVSRADQHPGLPAAADRRDAAHPRSKAVVDAGPEQPARRAGADQCRARRPAKRGGACWTA